MPQHIFQGQGEPSNSLLAESGAHYIDTDAENHYLAIAMRDEPGGPIVETRWTRVAEQRAEEGSFVEGAATINVFSRGSSQPLSYAVWQPIDTPRLVLPDLADYPGVMQVTAEDYLLTVGNPADGLVIENVTSEIVCSETITAVQGSAGSYVVALPASSVMLQLRRLDAGPWVLMVHSLPGTGGA